MDRCKGVRGLHSRAAHTALAQWLAANPALMAPLTDRLTRGCPHLARAVVEATPVNSQAVMIAVSHGFHDWLHDHWRTVSAAKPAWHRSWGACIADGLAKSPAPADRYEKLKRCINLSIEDETTIQLTLGLGCCRHITNIAWEGHLDALELILDVQPGGIEARDWNHHTPLWVAAEKSHVDCVRLLLARGAEITEDIRERHGSVNDRSRDPRRTAVADMIENAWQRRQ
jgi:hypothetical protein